MLLRFCRGAGRFPGWQAVTSVYAVAVLLVYGWTAYWIVWELPSWIYYLTLPEILLVISYTMVVNLLESLAVMVGVLLVSFVVPRSWFADRFSAAGSLLSIVVGLVLMYYSGPVQSAESFAYAPLIQMGLLFLAGLGLAILLARWRPLADFLDLLADRARIFLYLSLPFSALALLVVIIRNLAA